MMNKLTTRIWIILMIPFYLPAAFIVVFIIIPLTEKKITIRQSFKDCFDVIKKDWKA